MEYNMVNGINLTIDKPYPKVIKYNENLKLAEIIHKAYAGVGSELTAVMTYSYQHIIIDERYKDLKKAMETIAITEMKHLEILGKMIKNLGGIPKYIFRNELNNVIYWDASIVYYNEDIPSLLKNNIMAEKEAIKYYNYILKNADNENIKDIIKRIIMDEKNHIAIFTSLLKQFI